MQKRYFNWQDADRSDWVNRQHLAMIPPGLYRGFDVKNIASAGTNLILSHTTTSFIEVDVNQVTSPPKGVWISPQAVVVQEDAAVPVTVEGNLDSLPRIDIIVAEHVYVASVGGVDAGYTYIKGTPAVSPVAPNLTDPSKQIIIGYLRWPGGVTDVANSGVVYTRAKSAFFGQNTDVVFRDGTQNILGLKRILAFLNTETYLTYNGGDFSLNGTVVSNTYVLSNISSAYEYVNTLTIPLPVTGEGFLMIKVRTEQRLRLSGLTFHVAGDGSGIVSEIYIEAGEIIEFWDFRILGGLIYVVRGSEANRSKVNKFLKQVMFNKGSAIFSGVTGQIDLGERDGNFYELSRNFDTVPGVAVINAITNSSAYATQTPTTKAGSLIFLKFNNLSATVGTWNMVFGASPDPGYKPILYPGYSTISLTGGAIVALIEDEENYRVISVMDSKYSILKIVDDYLALNQNQEHVWKKTQSTNWIVLPGTAYSQANKTLTIPNTGNSFDIALDGGLNNLGEFIGDILIDRTADGGGIVDAPAGLIINVRIRIAPSVGGDPNNFSIRVNSTRNIRSAFTDLYRQSEDNSKYSIVSDFDEGDILTFRKTTTYWELISVSTAAIQGLASRIKNVEDRVASAGLISFSSNASFGTSGGETPPNLRTYIDGVTRRIEGRMTKKSDNTGVIICIVPPEFRPTQNPAINEPQVVGTLMQVTSVSTEPKIYGVGINRAGELSVIGGTTALADMSTLAVYFLQVTYALIPPIG